MPEQAAVWAPTTALIPWGAAWSSLGPGFGATSPQHSPAATKWAPRGQPELPPAFDCHPRGWDDYTHNHIIEAYLSLYLNYKTSLHYFCILTKDSWKSVLYHMGFFLVRALSCRLVTKWRSSLQNTWVCTPFPHVSQLAFTLVSGRDFESVHMSKSCSWICIPQYFKAWVHSLRISSSNLRWHLSEDITLQWKLMFTFLVQTNAH